jgi:hypothetical protein
MRKIFNYLLLCVLSLFIVITINAQSDPGTENLKHSWLFNNGTADDNIGNANGTLMGGAYILEGSLFTDAPDSWLEMPADSISMHTYTGVTIEAWYRPSGLTNTGYTMLAYFGNTKNKLGVDGYFMCAARGDDKSRAAISCGVETSPWTGESGANGPEYDDYELHHMVSTLCDTNITLYIDGVLMASTRLDTNNSIAKISSAHAYLAKSGYEDDVEWMGEILEFNIYNRALDSSEVLFLFNKGATATSVGNGITTHANEFSLSQNYPNPFNPTTLIRYSIPRNRYITLKIYNYVGQEIATLFEGEREPGNYEATFNGKGLASGVYFYRLSAGNFVDIKKLVLLK